MASTAEETSLEIYADETTLVGAILCGVAYGALMVLSIQTLFLLASVPVRRKFSSRMPWFLTSYVLAMLALGTVAFGANTRKTMTTYVLHKDFPAGPSAYNGVTYANNLTMTGNAAFLLMSWMADGLMLWRFSLIFNFNYVLMAFPILIYLGTVTSAILLMVAIQHTETFHSIDSTNFAIAYWSLTISLNIILALAIAGRILWVRGGIRRTMGVEHSQQYVSVVAIVIESAALTVCWDLAFIICYARLTPFANVIISAMGQFTGVSPILILYRVAQGRAWSSTTIGAEGASTLQFNTSVFLKTDRSTAQQTGGTSTQIDIALEDGRMKGASAADVSLQSRHDWKEAATSA
ncbi:hypothetical protein HMN09_00006800 [Mycena chlorophos]|uniref:Uncharacterized protein n=1 Tax=Mycena chlorophos TaxID=658473 RepID=A0A8H6WLZ0_MYCCL|nr:hypothetical protein HMN09_00006800 [Mycena chlorophos]